MIESVDSLKLLKEINRQAAKHDRVVKVLLELHIAEEDTKSALHSLFYFYNHGLQRVWRCQTVSIQRIRCLWLNVCCSLCR